MNNLRKIIGGRIRDAREEAGRTQKELGEYLGYSTMGISHFESGSREPKFSDLEKIAQFFRKDLSFFLPSETTFFRAIPTDNPLIKKSLDDFDKYLETLDE